MALSEINPLYFLVAIAIGSLLVTAGIWIGKVNSDRQNFKEFMEKVREDFKEVRNDIRELRNDIKEVRNDIKEIFARLGPNLTTKSSPTRLTEFGKTVAECVDAKGITEQLAKKIQEEVKGKTNYQIQSYCEEYIRDEFEPSEETVLRFEECAFENGLKIREINIVLALELRDRLLEMQGSEQV